MHTGELAEGEGPVETGWANGSDELRRIQQSHVIGT